MPVDSSDASIKIKVVRASVESVSLYEITDHELEIFEEGAPTDIFLNFAILCLSTGLSFLVVILTVSIDNIYIFSSFLIVTIIGILGAAILFFLWRNSRSRMKDLCKKVRGRLATAAAGANANEEKIAETTAVSQTESAA